MLESKIILIIFIVICGILSLVSIIIANKKSEKFSESQTIDLTQITKANHSNDNHEQLTVMDQDDGKFEPMFLTVEGAKNKSPTDSVHLVIAGLLPAPDDNFKKYPKDQIFYMPNDHTPHHHGKASHHMGDGFKLNRAFVMSKLDYTDVNKQLKEFRPKLKDFNNGQSKTPIETWIHWTIPSNKKPYPNLIVKKDSIIWWDFTDHHNLYLITDKTRYDNNDKPNIDDDIEITDNVNDGMNIVVTIMDAVGIFYFMCTVSGHADLGHKIQIKVI